MTRKHFVQLAKVIAGFADTIGLGQVGRTKLASDIAAVCADANSQFDKRRFLTACGVTDNVNSSGTHTK